MLTRLDKAPFPWFGGKTDAAPYVWRALGDVAHYVEPFCGSLAVLLRRPHPCNRTYFSETVNDADGFLVNVWRSIQLSPQETAEFASWPVCEADIMARHLWLLKWADDRPLEHLMADVTWHDPQAAGYWLYGICSWIGGGWCDGSGKWIVGEDGRITERRDKSPGVGGDRPHLSDNGLGVHRPGTREPGAGTQLPRLSDDGLGVHRPGTREPGVGGHRPFLTNNGQGVHHAGTREPGVCDENTEFHPMTMPELRRWFEFLSARLRHVRIVNGDWARVLTTGATKMLEVRMNNGKCGIFLDPPYGHAANRSSGLYARDSFDVAQAVSAWCLDHGDDPDYRIVLAGFEGEHDHLEQHGWTVVEWFKKGFLKGGMAQLNKNGHQQHRERLWLSPHCLTGAPDTPQTTLNFDPEDEDDV